MSSSTVDLSVDGVTGHELRKRRGSFPLASKSEALSAEMLAPLPQANISRVASSVELLADDESKPLLKVNAKL